MLSKIDILPVGKLPPLGIVPTRMYAQVIRSEKRGKLQLEEVTIPEIKDDEVLVAVMAAGINYNNVWAMVGVPIDVIKYRMLRGSKEDFHIGGSDASGIVYKIGKSVTSVQVGSEVVLHAGYWDTNDPWIKSGGDPILSDTCQAWGYETNYGSFAQYTIVKEHQCLKKPAHLSWEEAAVYMLSGATTYRMLTHWTPNVIKPGEAVLIWGGCGGLGVMAIQIAKEFGALPVAVVNDDEKIQFCKKMGAIGAINRNHFSHWGIINKNSTLSGSHWKKEVKRFESELLQITGGISPSIVIEHPGEFTIPTSLYVCKKGGMVVTCGATSGYIGSFDLRHLWMFQKKIQGSHFASSKECESLNDLIIQKKIFPVLSKTYSFSEIENCLNLMKNNLHPPGNMAISIGNIA